MKSPRDPRKSVCRSCAAKAADKALLSLTHSIHIRCSLKGQLMQEEIAPKESSPACTRGASRSRTSLPCTERSTPATSARAASSLSPAEGEPQIHMGLVPSSHLRISVAANPSKGQAVCSAQRMCLPAHCMPGHSLANSGKFDFKVASCKAHSRISSRLALRVSGRFRSAGEKSLGR